MVTGAFIKTLPAARGTGAIPVNVVESDIGHAEAWDLGIQEPRIGSTERIDATWLWRRNYLRSAALEIVAGRQLAYLRLVTPAADGSAFSGRPDAAGQRLNLSTRTRAGLHISLVRRRCAPAGGHGRQRSALQGRVGSAR